MRTVFSSVADESLFMIRTAEDPARLVRVLVERGIDDARGYVYSTRDGDVRPGERVLVPLGGADRTTPGIVVAVGGRELLEGFDISRVKSISRRTGAVLPPDLIDLARWMSDYYLCPLGMVLAAMMPAAVKRDVGSRTVSVVGLADGSNEAVKGKAADVLGAIRGLPEGVLPATAKELSQRLGLPSTAMITRLTKVGALAESTRRTFAPPATGWDPSKVEARVGTPNVLSPEQLAAIAGIRASVGSFAVHLIRGVTGSGKTEVFLRVIEELGALGRTEGSALVLVPEIALTPQTAARFTSRFRDRGVAILHSGMSATERNRQWSLAASGEAGVVIGARSAVFAPVPRLGLVIVDEEHDASYKQDQLPRFSARDVAIVRAQRAGCPAILASATPSLESWRQAKRGKYRLWTLPRRVGGATLPSVSIVDLREERRRTSKPFGAIGPTLATALRSTLDQGGQAILLLNRRGFASYIACPDIRCGWSMQCVHCDVSMVVHKSGAPGGLALRCHHCQAEQVVPRACPVCGRPPMRLGHGTQRLELELERGFPGTAGSIARIDADTMQSARDYFDALRRFAAGEVRVLLGTQMIAKGLDYPNVRLVGVVNADTSLAMPDFRAAERTFQLVSQVAGRAGRGEHAGRVVVQTMNPSEPAIVLAARHDFEAFADAELGLREAAGLPPASRMARIVTRDEDAGRAEAAAIAVADLLRGSAAESVRVVGPMPCPLARVADQFRFAVEVLAPSVAELHAPLDRLRREGEIKSDARMAVDVDPVSLM